MKVVQEIYDEMVLEFEQCIGAAQRRYKRFSADFEQDPESALRNGVDSLVGHIGTERVASVLLAELKSPRVEGPGQAIRSTVELGRIMLEQTATGIHALDGRLGNALRCAEVQAFAEMYRFAGACRRAERQLSELA